MHRALGIENDGEGHEERADVVREVWESAEHTAQYINTLQDDTVPAIIKRTTHYCSD